MATGTDSRKRCSKRSARSSIVCLLPWKGALSSGPSRPRRPLERFVGLVAVLGKGQIQIERIQFLLPKLQGHRQDHARTPNSTDRNDSHCNYSSFGAALTPRKCLLLRSG